MKKLYGITTAMVTPFDESGRVMVESVEKMVEFLVRRGVHCLYPCGTTGEMLLMPEKDRKLMAETVVRQNKGRLTTYIHVGAMHTDETVRLAKHACDVGADGIGVVLLPFSAPIPTPWWSITARSAKACPRISRFICITSPGAPQTT